MKNLIKYLLFSCVAYTQCWDGNPIQCQVLDYVYGPRCTWYVIPNEYVECRGYDQFGRQVRVWKSCGVQFY